MAHSGHPHSTWCLVIIECRLEVDVLGSHYLTLALECRLKGGFFGPQRLLLIIIRLTPQLNQTPSLELKAPLHLHLEIMSRLLFTEKGEMMMALVASPGLMAMQLNE